MSVVTPVGTSVGNAVNPVVITSVTLNASVLILLIGPADIESVTALLNVCSVVSDEIPTLIVTVVLVTAEIVIGA